MQNDCSVFKIPSSERKETPDFDAKKSVLNSVPVTKRSVFSGNLTPTADAPFEFYQELTKISEEIEKCRLRYS